MAQLHPPPPLLFVGDHCLLVPRKLENLQMKSTSLIEERAIRTIHLKHIENRLELQNKQKRQS
jgi:hypothetical protein